MRKILLPLVLAISGLLLTWQFMRSYQPKLFSEVENELKEAEEEESLEQDGIRLAQEQDFEATKDIRLGYIPKDRLINASESLAKAKRAMRLNGTMKMAGLTWTERGPYTDAIGPSNGNGRGPGDAAVTGGRIRTIWVDLADPTNKTVWVGGIDGGVWKTTNITASPANWTPVNDLLGNLAVASICQDPSNPNIMYFGTGEKTFNSGAVRGGGVWKSTDHGATWNLLLSTAWMTNVSRIACDGAGNLYVAAIAPDGGLPTGVQRSKDGGKTWTNITPATLTSRITELKISSTGRLHVVCGYFDTPAGSAGYRFTDDPANVTSATWSAPATPFSPTQYNVEIACAGNTVYALPANSEFQTPTVFKSTDGGSHWSACVTSPPASGDNGNIDLSSGQGWVNLAIGVDPTNPNNVVVGGLNTYRTTDGGATWKQVAKWVGNDMAYVHADQHFVAWDKDQVMIASDGGLFYSADDGLNWSDRNTGLRIKQFYSCAIHPTLTNYFIAGAQDNGMHQMNSAGMGASTEFMGGDGMFGHIDQDEPQYQFGAYVYNTYSRSTDGGATFSNVVFSQSVGRFVNPSDYDDGGNKMYAAGNGGTFVRWENPQTGNAFTEVSVPAFHGEKVSHVMVSPHTANRVFFGVGGGYIVRVDQADQANPSAVDISDNNMNAANVSCVAVGTDDNYLLATFSNYGAKHVWVTTTGGGPSAWTNISGNLPDIPVRWAMFYPYDNTKAIIATEAGVYETTNINGAATVWTQSPSFPIVRTDMLQFRASDNLLLAATYGRGIWSTNIPVASPYLTFATTYASVEEKSDVTMNCLGYKEYKVNMAIAKAPSGMANLSLKATGTATEGVDFDFTTNGSFTSPSHVLTFADGSTAPQVITIRVYDDPYAEQNEDFTLSFTVGGATNAVAAPGQQTYTFIIKDNNDVTTAIPTPGTNTMYTVGKETYWLGDDTFGAPFDAKLQGKKTRMLYLASELTAQGVKTGKVNSFAFNVYQKNSKRPYKNLQIKMGSTTEAYLYDGFWTNNVTTNLVKSLGSYALTAGWNNFTLDAPFEWDGQSNLVVEVCYDNGAEDENDFVDLVYGYSDESLVKNMIWADNLSCGAALNTFSFFVTNGIKPMIRLNTGSGNEIETKENSSFTQYVGAGNAYYFMNQPNVMSMISNASASIGCLTTTVTAGGKTWQPFVNGSRSQKVFTITPGVAQNSITYNVGLYFTADELGGRQAATLRLAKTTAPNMAAANAGNTVVHPTTVTPFGNGYLFTATFTGFSSFFLVDAAVPLPVTLLTFQGRLENTAALLTWSTSSEQNSKNFVVEKSTDGVHFSPIGTVNAAGNSSSRRDYSFRDDRLSRLNHYRLQMNDRDGQVKTSDVVLLQYNAAEQKLLVINNPFSHFIDLRLAKEAKQVKLQLYSASGALIAEKSLSNVSGQIHWPLNREISAGSYFLRGAVDDQVYTYKLVKQ